MNEKLNSKKDTTAVKPKSKIQEWIDAIGYAVLFKYRATPKFKPGANKSRPPGPREE